MAEPEEPSQKPGAYTRLLAFLYGRGLIWKAAKVHYWVMAVASTCGAWWLLTAAAEVTGIAISVRIVMAMVLGVFAVSFVALARSVDRLPPDDDDSERDA